MNFIVMLIGVVEKPMHSSLQARLFGIVVALSLAGCSGGANVNPATKSQAEIPLQSLSKIQVASVNTDQCKDERWKNFGVFKNQGDCVSYFATQQKCLKNTPPGKISEFMYVANQLSNNVSALAIDKASGTLGAVVGSPFLAHNNPIGVTTDPAGKFVYVANWLSADVSAYAIDATTGALTPVPGSPFATSDRPRGVTVDSTGRFLYVPSAGHAHNVTAFTINASTGALTPMLGSPFASAGIPQELVFDPTGRFAYVPTGYGIWVYAVDAFTGALATVAGSPFPAGNDPGSIVLDSTGKFAYATNFDDGSISEYAIDPLSGALTSVGTVLHAGSIAIGADPLGQFVYTTGGDYVANGNPNPADAVAGFRIDEASGLLAPLSGSPFPAQPGYVTAGIAVDPTGSFAYATNIGGGNSVSAYRVDKGSGNLAAVPCSPFLTGGWRPWSIAITQKH